MDYIELEQLAPEGWFDQYNMSVLVPDVEAIPTGGLYLEIGVYKGRSLWITRGAADPSVEVWGIDVRRDPKIKGTNFIRGESGKVEWDKPIDVLFIDGDHSYEGCKADIDKYAPFVKPGGVILFHDCDHSSPGVVKAAQEFADTKGLQLIQFCKIDDKNSMGRIQL